MKTSIPSSITVEEAVARLINLDYIPTGFTLDEMTSAFLEEAEVEYHNACLDRSAAGQLDALKDRVDVCRARHYLGQKLHDALIQELKKTIDSPIELSTDSGVTTRLKLDSVLDWASDRFGLHFAERSTLRADNHGPNGPSGINAHWEQVTVKVYADFKLGFKLEGGRYKKLAFQDVGLMGGRKNAPNALGVLLIGLAQGKKFPSGSTLEAKHKTAISKLRRCLEQLTGLAGEPFLPFNAADGWKPRFKLIDDRRNAADRAKERAVHVPLDEARDFDIEDDDAQRFIDENS